MRLINGVAVEKPQITIIDLWLKLCVCVIKRLTLDDVMINLCRTDSTTNKKYHQNMRADEQL